MKTTEELEALYEDASNALSEAIDSGRLRLSVPADPKRDHDLRIQAALNELPRAVVAMNEELEVRISMAIGRVVSLARYYPDAVQARMLGRDTTKLRNAVTEAVLKELRA